MYKLTKISCYSGILVQAVVCNLMAVLFIPLMELYSLSYVHLGMLVAVNFIAQVAVDILFSGMIDKYGFKKLALPAVFFAFCGLVLFGLTPFLFPENILAGLTVSTIVFASASGFLEVLISPMTDAIPSEDKGASMSLMHSFYAWGSVLTVVLTTVYIYVFGSAHWYIAVFLWAMIPFVNFFMFCFSKFPDAKPVQTRREKKKIFLNMK